MFLFSLFATAIASGPAPELINGHYTLNEPYETMSERRESAMEKSIQEMNILYRSVARYRLSQRPDVCEHYQFSLENQVFSILCDQSDLFKVRIDGRKGDYTSDESQDFDVIAHSEGDNVYIHFAGEDGGQRDTYQFSSKGVIITKEIYSPHLSVPLRIQISYQRLSSAPSN